MKRLEGVRLDVYADQARHPTIGVGHLLTPDDVGLGQSHGVNDSEIFAAARAKWPHGLAPAAVDQLLTDDLLRFESGVSQAVRVRLTGNQADALIIFAFNVGVGAFAKSTLLRRLNAGEYDAVPEEMARWNKITSNGVTLISNGLVKRRQAEIDLWNGAHATSAKGGA